MLQWFFCPDFDQHCFPTPGESDSLLLASIALFCTLALWANDIQGSEGINSFITALAIFLILSYLAVIHLCHHVPCGQQGIWEMLL